MAGTRSKQVRDKMLVKITEMLDKWKTDQEIMDKLKMPHMTYYRYKQQIYQNDKTLLKEQRSNELDHRIMQVRKSLEYCIKVNVDICEHSKDDKARIEASAMIVKANMGLLNLAKEPHYNEQIKIIHRDVNADKQQSI